MVLQSDSEKSSSRLLLLSLVIAIFSTVVIDVMIPLFLVDIAKTFQVTPAIASQIRTFSAVGQIIPALLIGLLVVRFQGKSLLIAGVLCISIAAAGSYFAMNVGEMQFFYSFNGIGSVIVSAMALAIVGEVYPLEKKGQAVGVLTATGSLGYLIGGPLSAVISNLGGWRSTFMILVFPVSIVGVFLSFYFIPSRPQKEPKTVKEPYWRGFGEIFRRRSAIACLIFEVFFIILFSIGTFGIAFFKETFEISTVFGSTIMFGGALSGTLGSLVSGRSINRCGRKTLAILTNTMAGLFTMIAFYMPSLWMAMSLRFLTMFFWGMALTASTSLMLEQVPKFKGSMMSLRVAFAGVGSAIGVVTGGFVLAMFNYQTAAFTLGGMGIIGTIILLFTKDPCSLR